MRAALAAPSTAAVARQGGRPPPRWGRLVSHGGGGRRGGGAPAHTRARARGNAAESGRRICLIHACLIADISFFLMSATERVAPRRAATAEV